LDANVCSPTVFTGIGEIHILKRHHARESKPSQKAHHWGAEINHDRFDLRRNEQASRRTSI
jgi:hypothetical protein